MTAKPVPEHISDERLAELSSLYAGVPTHDAKAIVTALTELQHRREAEAGKATHRHVKRGSEYVLIGIGKMQAEGWITLDVYFPDREHQSVDMREVAIYRSVDDGSLWVRPREEFEDGRFVALFALGEHP